MLKTKPTFYECGFDFFNFDSTLLVVFFGIFWLSMPWPLEP